MSKYPKTPELDKIQEYKEVSQELGCFIDWLSSDLSIPLCKWEDELQDYYPVHRSIESLLAQYYDIDLNIVEEERRAILDYLSEQNER